jgi:hypothetical protein
MTASRLTPAQERMLAEVRRAGEKVYNGRARRTVEALKAHFLIEYDYELVSHIKGGGTRYTEQFTVRPVLEDKIESRRQLRRDVVDS